MGAVLTLRDIRQHRGGRELLRLDRLDLPPGGRLAVLGPNGAGKTTLLRLLAGIDQPSAGVIEVNGTPTTRLSLTQRRQITFVTQRAGLLATTVRRNIELPLAWRGLKGPARRPRVDAVLEQLGLTSLAARSAPTLSGGEQQRVNLARALVTDPALLLLDEPAVGLDPEARRRFLADAARAVTERGTTLVHVSHRPDEVLSGADQVAILVTGTLRQIDTPAAVTRHPVDAGVARLLGYDNVLDASIDSRGRVHIAGRPTPVTCRRPLGPATLAIWATGVTISPDQTGIPATVTAVTPTAGEWTITLTAGQPITARMRLDQPPPSRGDLVGLHLNPHLAVVIP